MFRPTLKKIKEENNETTQMSDSSIDREDWQEKINTLKAALKRAEDFTKEMNKNLENLEINFNDDMQNKITPKK
jgi:hypothetical protein